MLQFLFHVCLVLASDPTGEPTSEPTGIPTGMPSFKPTKMLPGTPDEYNFEMEKSEKIKSNIDNQLKTNRGWSSYPSGSGGKGSSSAGRLEAAAAVSAAADVNGIHSSVKAAISSIGQKQAEISARVDAKIQELSAVRAKASTKAKGTRKK